MDTIISYYINKMLGKEPTPGQKKAYEKATSSQKTSAQKRAEARKYDRGYGGAASGAKDTRGSEPSRRPSSPPTRPVVGKKSDTAMASKKSNAPTSDSKPAVQASKSSGRDTPPKPTLRPERKLSKSGDAKSREPSGSKGPEKAKAESVKKFLAGTPDNSRTKGNRDARSAGYKLAKSLGDTRTEKQMIADRKNNAKDEEEMGR